MRSKATSVAIKYTVVAALLALLLFMAACVPLLAAAEEPIPAQTGEAAEPSTPESAGALPQGEPAPTEIEEAPSGGVEQGGTEAKPPEGEHSPPQEEPEDPDSSGLETEEDGAEPGQMGIASLEATADDLVLPNAVGNGYFSNVGYATTPPGSPDISIADRFAFTGFTGYDLEHPNVAVVSDDSNYSYGAMWSKEKLDLTQQFSTDIALYMAHSTNTGGNLTANLGDGMTFTLHNDPRGLAAIGSDGEGLGVYGSTYYYNYKPSTNPVAVVERAVAIEFDLFFNSYKPNPYVGDNSSQADKDHYMFDDYDRNNLIDPYAKIYETKGNCAAICPPWPLKQVRINHTDHLKSFFFDKKADWLPFTASWAPFYTSGVLGGVLTYTFGGQTKTLTFSDVNAFFGGTEVYWGFTGATGEYRSVLAAAVTDWPEQNPKKEVTSDVGRYGAEVTVLDELTYTITYENHTKSAAQILIRDVLPAGTDYVSSTGGGQYDPDTRTVSWTVNNVPNQSVGSVTVTVRVNDTAGDTIENEASVSVAGGAPKTTGRVVNPVVRAAAPWLTVHIRQIVVDRANSAVELPAAGYVQLQYGGSVSPAIVSSGVDGQPVDFTTFRVPNTGDACFLAAIVPQHYTYQGHVATPTNEPHQSSARSPGNPVLDPVGQGVTEYWVSLYISPQTGDPPFYEWDTRTNDFS